MRIYFFVIIVLLAVGACGNGDANEAQSTPQKETYVAPVLPKEVIGSDFFYGNWINQYYVEATTKKDTLRSYVSYEFSNQGTYKTDSGINDKWAYNESANTFFLYYSGGTTYAEYEVEVVNSEEFNFKRIYDNNLFIYNFKKIK